MQSLTNRFDKSILPVCYNIECDIHYSICSKTLGLSDFWSGSDQRTSFQIGGSVWTLDLEFEISRSQKYQSTYVYAGVINSAQTVLIKARANGMRWMLNVGLIRLDHEICM